MSALRISVPGQETRLIPLGHDRAGWGARAAIARYGGIGGALVVPVRPPKKGLAHLTEAQARAIAARALRMAERPRCGHRMQTGALCARVPGHVMHDHRSAEQLKRSRDRRRASNAV